VPGVATRERRIDRADRLAAELRRRAGVELRTARRIAGLTQEQVGGRVRVSHAEICRIELGRAPWVTIQTLCRIGAVVGLELSIRFYPGPSPVRDVRSAEIMAEFARHLAPPLVLRTEVPLPIPGDQRAWDGMIVGTTAKRAGVEVETEVHDAQALERRIALKQRDGETPVVILVLADTRRNRAAVRAGWGTLGPRFPARGAEILVALGAGQVPVESGIVWMRAPRRH
jgi:transcriptional regulator with XRE-family HTH domain